jgi:glyoxylase-like metal-dependent hydrolase (beta-lactamase superfamily II)
MSSSNSTLLPSPSHNQTYVTVSPIAGGFITLSEQFFVSPAIQDAKRTVPSLTFLVTHPGTSSFDADPSKPFRMMFDLGLRRAKERYPDHLQRHIDGRAPHRLPPGVAAQLKAGGLSPADVDLVMLSHVHYDHHGDPEDFLNAKFVIGYGAMDVLKKGLGGIAPHQHFEPDTLPDDRSSELSDPRGSDWKPLGPFPAALDLFGDGSVFVIDMPGHLPGHLNLLCRTKDRWLCLCGDSFHDPRLLTGEKEIGTWTSTEGNTLCIHLDKEAAAASIEQLQEFQKMGGEEVELIAAHDEEWWEKNKEKQFPMLL